MRPQEVASNTGVSVGFTIAAGGAAVQRTLAPIGFVRLLLTIGAVPLFPEQRAFERRLDAGSRARWRDAVERSVRGPALAELRSVIPASREAAYLSGPSTLRETPVVLITSNAYGPEWVRMHDRIAERYPRGEHRLTGARNHNIHLAQPELVAEAIAALRSAVGAER